MANIKISDLSPAGFELFRDPESFLNELKEDEMGTIRGSNGFKLSLFLKILNRLSIAYKDWTGNSIQTVFSNSMNGNDLLRVGSGKTVNGQSINGVSISNVNTI